MNSLLWFVAGAGWMLTIVGIIAALAVAGREETRMQADADSSESDGTDGTPRHVLWVYDGGPDAS